MIQINIELKPQNQLKIFFHKIHSKSEHILFSIITKIPEHLIPSFLMNWTERYTTNRIESLKQQIVRDRWKSVELNKAIEHICDTHQNTK